MCSAAGACGCARASYADATVYGDDPAEVARGFIDAGATRIHVVDLDAARGRGTPASADAVRAIIAACAAGGCDVEVGGGVRDVDTARALARCRRDVRHPRQRRGS